MQPISTEKQERLRIENAFRGDVYDLLEGKVPAHFSVHSDNFEREFVFEENSNQKWYELVLFYAIAQVYFNESPESFAFSLEPRNNPKRKSTLNYFLCPH